MLRSVKVNNRTHSAFPFFGVYNFDRAEPAIVRVIEDTNLRQNLFGKEVN